MPDWPHSEHETLWNARKNPNPLLHPHRATPDLRATGEFIGRSDGSNLVMGDLNRTDGSPHFAAFVRAIGLRDSRLGFGSQPSWPSWSPYRVAIIDAGRVLRTGALDELLGDDAAVVTVRHGRSLEQLFMHLTNRSLRD